MSSYFLALSYFFASFMIFTKFRRLNAFLSSRRVRWSILQLFVLSIGLGSIFRCMSFSTLCILDFQQIQSSGSRERLRQKSSDDLSFYNKIVAILFNMPDYLFVSSYLLLVLVWAESFQSSRRHWFSAQVFRRRWMIFYLIFNACLYSTQLILYALLILFDDQDIYTDPQGHRLRLITGLIFYCLAAADLALPAIIFVSWIYLTLTLSGFPFKSSAAKDRLTRVGRVAVAWSFGRILYSIMILLTFTRGWFNVNGTEQSMVLVAVFFSSELIPIYLALDSELLAMLSADDYEPLEASTA